MAEGSDQATIFDCDAGTRNFVAFVQSPDVALQLLRKGAMKGTALLVAGDDIKKICGITEYPEVAVINRKTGSAAFHLQGRRGLETSARCTFAEVQDMTEKEFQAAVTSAAQRGRQAAR